MAERKVNCPSGFSKSLAEAACVRCLCHHECEPKFDVVDNRVVVAGNHAGVSRKCLFASGESRGPVIEFKPLGVSGDFIAEDFEEVLGSTIEIGDRMAMAVLTCFHCPLVSNCKPDYYVFGQLEKNETNIYVIVKGDNVQSSDCRLTNVK